MWMSNREIHRLLRSGRGGGRLTNSFTRKLIRWLMNRDRFVQRSRIVAIGFSDSSFALLMRASHRKTSSPCEQDFRVVKMQLVVLRVKELPVVSSVIMNFIIYTLDICFFSLSRMSIHMDKVIEFRTVRNSHSKTHSSHD